MTADSFSSGHDPTGKAFAGSIFTHAAIVGLLVASGLWHVTRNDFGSPKASTGSVGVNMVKTIPIPRNDGPVNALANDTKSVVPEKPLPLQPRKQVK